MLWENLTTKQFEEAVVSTTRVCVLPIGCLEKHGDHLPLGTDMMIGRAVTEQAAKLEPFVIFPYYLFGQVSEVRHWAGTVAISSSLQMMLLNEVVKEIRRNGFNKIVLANAHGGNNYWLRYFVQTMLDERRDYIVYTYDLWELNQEQFQHLDANFETPENYGHADHMETSQMMHINSLLVQMDKMNSGEWNPLGRGGWMAEEKLSAGIHWYTEYPNHIAGDPSLSTATYGKTYIEFCSANFAKAVKRLKQDDTALELQNEFFNKCDDVSSIR